MYHQITQETRDAIIAARKDGKRSMEIAAQTGVSLSMVSKILSKAGLGYPARTHRNPNHTLFIEKVAAFIKGGRTVSEIVDLLPGITKQQVYQATNQARTRGLLPLLQHDTPKGAAKPAHQPNHRPKMKPIVLGAETVSQTDERRLLAAIDAMWSRLSLDDKLAAIESLK